MTHAYLYKMANSSVGINGMNSVICVACGLGIKETPKLQRNLGSRYKGCKHP